MTEDNTSFDKSNPFSANGSKPNGASPILTALTEAKTESKTESRRSRPSFDVPVPNKTKKRGHHRRGSSFSKSYQDLESLQFTDFQDQCKNGSNLTASLIRLLGKLCDGYDKFGKNLTHTVEQETNFIHKCTSKSHDNSSFLSSYTLLCQFTSDLATNFQQIAAQVKTTMIDPLIEFQKQCDTKYSTIYKKHEHAHHKYISDENHLNSYNDKYKSMISDEKNKFKLIQLLSASIMPPNDHKTLKKSWHSPSRFNKSVSKFIEKAKTKTLRKVSINLGNNKLLSSSDNEQNDEKKVEIDDIYELHTKEELDRNNMDKKEHIPLLYAMYRYSNTRNKLLIAEDAFIQQIENVNHSMTQYEYIRKGSMKAMKKMEIERLTHSKKIYVALCSTFGLDDFDINNQPKKHIISFINFKESVDKLESSVEFHNFVSKNEKKYVKPSRLVSSLMLTAWRTPYHLFEDLMFNQINNQHMNKNTLKIPYIFEYLMEHIESQSAINDPDIFMLNAISPKESNIDHSFAYWNNDLLTSIKTTDMMAIPVLCKQINELYECKQINITDHHHAIILLKLWLYKSPEPIIPYYLYDTVCLFQFQNSVKQRAKFVKTEILNKLSTVRIHCLARLVAICKKIVKQQNQITIIDLSYELSNVIIRNPMIDKFRQLDPVNNSNDNLDDISKLKLMLDPQTTYKLPLSPSHQIKRAEMAFITYILSNHVPMLNDKKLVNHGPKLSIK